ncbi:MAG: ATP-binding protein [Chitinophagaceae bacterium]|nr:ATP-binding protein [Chitinophagaceae bacterium]
MKRRLIILLFYGVSNLPARAQSGSVSFRNININEGLSQSSVVDIAADNAGFLWFATQDGLNRFDGKDFLVFKKNFDDITTTTGSTTGKLAVGNRNDLWIITSGGKLERMNLYDQTMIAVPMLNGIRLPPVSCIYPDDDNLWIGTEMQGLFIYNLTTKNLLHYTTEADSPIKLNSNQIQEIFEDKQSRKWILTANGASVFNDIHSIDKTLLNLPDNDQKKIISFSSMAEDSRNTLWMGTYGKGLFLRRKNDSAFHGFTGYNSVTKLPENLTIFSIMADQFNRIWIGTYGQGLFVISPDDESITHILSDKKNSLSLGYNDVLSIRQDKKGGIWIGTDGGGVSYYDRRLNNFTLFSTSNLPEDVSIEQIRSITVDKEGGIWVGTSNNGLTLLGPSDKYAETIHFLPYKQSISNPERIVSLLTDEEGDIWVGTQGNGLLIIDPKTKKIKRQFYPDSTARLKIPDHTIWCMHAAANKNVWIGTRNAGLSLINKQTGIVKNYMYHPGSNNSVAENNVRKIISIDDTTLCIGYEKKGIQFFNTRQNRFFNIPALEASWQSEITVKTLYFNDHVLWIGTLGKGIITYNIKTKEVNFIAEEHGLTNHTIYGIVPDKNGSLWLSSNKGITRFMPPANLKLVNRSHFMVFSVEDGLQSNEFNTGAYYRSSKGLLYFGGIKGLNVFDPAKMFITNQPINTVIIHATINNQPFNGDTNIIYKKTLLLKHHNNSLSFNFAALDFVSANKLSYYYQLSNYEKTWINAGNRNYASYTNLPPGEYIFKVKASNDIESSKDPVTTLTIIIAPPFWKTWWFIVLCITAILGVLYGLYRYRINQLIELQQVRNRIATDLHDDIGSTLTNISILSELSRKNMQNQEQTKNFLNRISEEVYFSNQALDDIVWSINTSNDTLEQTVARMRRYAAEMFDGANISYTLHLDEQFEQYKLNMDQRRDCFLLFKEAINNIYKHAKAKNVSIKVSVERSQLHMEIRDDGKGFDTSTVTNRNGIKNMQSRITKRKGSIKIKSEEGKGTFTELRFPL